MHVPDFTTSKTAGTAKSLQQVFINFQYCSLKTGGKQVWPFEMADFFHRKRDFPVKLDVKYLTSPDSHKCLLTPIISGQVFLLSRTL